MKNRYEFLFEEVNRLAEEQKCKYKNNQACRDDLLEFLDMNDWFAMSRDGEGINIKVCFNEKAVSSIKFWLLAYKKCPEEKIHILLDAYASKYPNTCEKLKNYVEEKNCINQMCVCKAIDFMLYTIKSDLDIYAEKTTSKIMELASQELSISGMKFITAFLSEMTNDNNQWRYIFDKRKIIENNNEAYEIRDYAVMAYCTFNEENWEKQDMQNLALSSKKYADVWIFIALHFISGLRRIDMMRLPCPKLPDDKEVIRKCIAANNADEMSKKIVDEWEFRLGLMSAVPSKTKRYGDVPQLKVFIPETLRVPIGIILLIVAIHHVDGEMLFKVRNEYHILREFFGEKFIEACGGRRFSTRRANKSYLQGIKFIGNDGHNAKGYMLAALARSHKGGIGSLPETTDVYLRDEVFSGYKSEFILREMFERGIFGFIPVLLLKSYDEQKFLELGVPGQTALIKELGLNANQLEDITGMVDRALVHVRECVGKIMSEGINSHDSVSLLLQRLVADGAPAKQPDFLCLRIASGDKCISSDRGTCIGCGYEVYTKAAFYTIVKEYRLLNKKRKNASKMEAFRYQQILKKAILPAVTEVLESMKKLYPQEDNGILLDILEGGLKVECSD